MTEYALRKPCASGGGNCAQRKGQHAAHQAGCCCDTEQCVTVWKATPCFAGTTSGTKCGCGRAYPTKAIYVCTDAKCGCTGSSLAVGAVILTAYDFAPGVKWCFTVHNQPSDQVYNTADLDPSETVVGFGTKCVECIPAGCGSASCPGPRGRWVKPKRCDSTKAPCPWVCPSKIIGTPCSVINPDGVGCCYFDPVETLEGFFDDCPNEPYYTGFWLGGGDTTCCACESGCGGVLLYRSGTPQSGCASTQVCNTQTPNPKQCCCGTCPGGSVTFSWYSVLTYLANVETSRFSGTCDCQGNGSVVLEDCYNGDCDQQTVSCQGYYPAFSLGDPCPMLNIPVGGLGSGFGPNKCWGACPDPSYQTNTTTGYISATCSTWDTNLESRIRYTPQSGGDLRVETIVAHAEFTRNVGPKCLPTCDGSIVYRPGQNRTRRMGEGEPTTSGEFF